MNKKIFNLLGYSMHKEKISLLYENMKNGSLSSLLSNSQKDALSFETRMKFFGFNKIYGGIT